MLREIVDKIKQNNKTLQKMSREEMREEIERLEKQLAKQKTEQNGRNTLTPERSSYDTAWICEQEHIQNNTG